MGLKARNLETGERGSAGDGAQRAAEAGRETTRTPAESSGEGSVQRRIFSLISY